LFENPELISIAPMSAAAVQCIEHHKSGALFTTGGTATGKCGLQLSGQTEIHFL